MTVLRRLLPRDDTSVVIELIQRDLSLIDIEPPTVGGQPAIVWFGPPGSDVSTIGVVADPVVGFNYLVLVDDLREPATEAVLGRLDVITEDELLARPLDDPWDAADVAVTLGVVAAVPWSAEVEARIASLERHEEIGVEASARLARQYRAALEQAIGPPQLP